MIKIGANAFVTLGVANTVALRSYSFTVTGQAEVDGRTLTRTATFSVEVLAPDTTAVTVTVAKSLTFTIDTTSYTLAMDPSLPALADQTQNVVLTVLTNANSGYTLTVSDNAAGLQSSATGNPTIADVSTGKATSVVWPGGDKHGYTVTGTGATIDSAFTGSKYAGYVAAGEQIASRTNATGATADTITIANRVSIDYGAQAGDYTDTITYTVTPNYN